MYFTTFCYNGRTLEDFLNDVHFLNVNEKALYLNE